MPNPRVVTLVADTSTPVDLGSNFGAVEVALIANPATTVFTTDGSTLNSSTPADGRHTVTSLVPAKTVLDQTTGNTVVNLRSAGTPTVEVTGL